MIASHIVAIIFKLKYLYIMVLCVNLYLLTRHVINLQSAIGYRSFRMYFSRINQKFYNMLHIFAWTCQMYFSNQIMQ